MKKQIIVLLISLTFSLSSCGFFRSIGLYNTPPDYADTFEEINGVSFIDHPNKTSNLVLKLSTTQKVFSPYDSIYLQLKITNLSNDYTMYVVPSGLNVYSYLNQELIVTDSINRKLKITNSTVPVDYTSIADDYGRIVKPTLAPNSIYMIEPRQTRNNELKFQTGNSIFPVLYEMAFAMKKENSPGSYNAYYVLSHEEYDNIIGPKKTKLISNTIEYLVRNYTEEELLEKKDVKFIVEKIDRGKNLEIVDSLIISYQKKYPNSYYSHDLLEFWESKKILEKKETR